MHTCNQCCLNKSCITPLEILIDINIMKIEVHVIKCKDLNDELFVIKKSF